MPYTFDCDQKLIQLGDTSPLDMKDLYSRWKDAVLSGELPQCDQALRVTLEPLSGSEFLGPYYFVMNNWQIRPFNVQHELIVSGAVVADDTSTIGVFKLDDLTAAVSIVRQVPVTVQTVQTGVSGLTAEESAALLSIPADVWDVPYSAHTTAGTFGKLIDIIRKSNTAVDGAVVGAPNAPTTTAFDTNLADPTGTHDHQVILFTTGALTGLSRPIFTFTNGVTNTVTLQEPLPIAPADGDEFVILAQHVHPITDIQAGLATKKDVINASQL